MSGFVPCEHGWSLTDWLREKVAFAIRSSIGSQSAGIHPPFAVLLGRVAPSHAGGVLIARLFEAEPRQTSWKDGKLASPVISKF
jgi:hypothetical protein